MEPGCSRGGRRARPHDTRRVPPVPGSAFLIVIPIITLRPLTAVVVVALLAAVAGCGGDGSADARPHVVVTTPVLGSLVREVVGDDARVTVVMPNGADPHGFQPSAKDVEAIAEADLVVENGLGLEEGLEDPLQQARDDGVPFFTATDHVRVREASGLEAEGAEEGDHEHGAGDPHIWMDPIAMRGVVRALAPALRRDVGIDVTARAGAVERELTALDGDVRRILAPIPAAHRTLVTGHESMGYFADRYGLRAIGAVVPSLSSQAQASARSLAELGDAVRAAGVPAVFTEIGTPEDVAEAVADETGARLVEVGTHTLPDDGSYATFMRGAARAVAGGLGGEARGAR
jgi:zinc/manganese transport system substrate-binding protein